MRVKEYQLDELARARTLQDEAAKLHIPVPVLSYRYEIANADGNIEEKGIGKSNSYTRNALNAIAVTAGLCAGALPKIHADGGIGAKIISGTIDDSPKDYARYDYTPTYDGQVLLGTSSAAENLNSYLAPTSGLTKISNAANSVFNSVTRKLITTLTGTFKNNTAATIDITESGVTIMRYTTTESAHLFIRDVFTAVPVEPGKTITWTYVTEVAYPEP